ncbi:uncharacterized protein ISCGN_031875 [Ixodes scapularis]
MCKKLTHALYYFSPATASSLWPLLLTYQNRYRFWYVNVGTSGRCHDAHVFRRSALAKILERPTFTTPMVTINGSAVPLLVLCDQAFPLTYNMLKPYARKNVTGKSPHEKFNRQLSSACRVLENAFGRIKARFRFIMKRLESLWGRTESRFVDNARFVIRSCCTLNNICEHFNDGVESQWLTEVGTEARLYEQPVCNTDAVAGNGSIKRAAWIRAVRRVDKSDPLKNWKPSQLFRLCSAHFITGKPALDKAHPDYVPTLFTYSRPRPSALGRF